MPNFPRRVAVVERASGAAWIRKQKMLAWLWSEQVKRASGAN